MSDETCLQLPNLGILKAGASKEMLTEQQIDEKIAEIVEMLRDDSESFESKLHAVIRIPKVLNHQFLSRERSDKIFASIPLEIFTKVYDANDMTYSHFRIVFIHIIAFFCQCSSPEVHMRAKPCLPGLMKTSSPKDLRVPPRSAVYSDLAIIIAFWVDSKGEGRLVYDALRYVTGYYAAQKRDLNAGEFLLSVRLLLNKIYHLATVEPYNYDNRGWPFAILSVVRDLLQHGHEKFTKEMRSLMWEIISAMTRFQLGGLPWFNTDRSFAKLVIQLNHVEMQMALHDPENVDVMAFNRHLRVLELYTNAICDKEMFGEDEFEVIPHTVGDSTRYLLTFWVECHLQKIILPDAVALSIYNYANFLFVHEELAITEERIRKNLGTVFLEHAFKVLGSSSQSELYGEVGQMFGDLMEKLHEFEQLDDRVPLLIVQFLDKLRTVEHYEEWKGRVIDCQCALMDLRGRVDWYSKKTLQEARELCKKFTEPEKHEMKQIITAFNQLPLVN